MDFQLLRVRLSGEAELEFERIVCASREQRERWSARRARWRHGQYQKQSYQLREAHKHTTVCIECGALVDLQSARRIARSAGRSIFQPGDGCAGRSCSARFWPSRFQTGQQLKAHALLSGDRLLVMWPSTIRARTELWTLPACMVRHKALAISKIHK